MFFSIVMSLTLLSPIVVSYFSVETEAIAVEESSDTNLESETDEKEVLLLDINWLIVPVVLKKRTNFYYFNKTVPLEDKRILLPPPESVS